jgi:hypothetical protein
MSLDLQPFAASGEWASPFEHIDPDGEILAVPADEQPVVLDDDAYDWDRP